MSKGISYHDHLLIIDSDGHEKVVADIRGLARKRIYGTLET